MSPPAKLTDLTKNLEEDASTPKRSSIVLALAVLCAVAALLAVLSPFVFPARPGQPIPTQRPVAPPLPGIAADTSKNYTRPVQELVRYATTLSAQTTAFDPAITGEEAARRLGHTRLFAAAYEELRLAVRRNGPVSLLPALAKLIEEEQGIDFLMARRLRVTAIAYLRALQNGDIGFPVPADHAPTPETIVAQIAHLHPEVALDPNDATFAHIYRQTREFANARVQQAGELSVFEVIGEWRRSIIASVLKPPVPGHSL